MVKLHNEVGIVCLPGGHWRVTRVNSEYGRRNIVVDRIKWTL